MFKAIIRTGNAAASTQATIYITMATSSVNASTPIKLLTSPSMSQSKSWAEIVVLNYIYVIISAHLLPVFS